MVVSSEGGQLSVMQQNKNLEVLSAVGKSYPLLVCEILKIL